MRRWHGPRRLSDSAIHDLLVGVLRNGSNPRYFKINADGKHEWVGIKKALTAIGVGHSTITWLLKEAVETGLIKVGEFKKSEREPIPRIKKEKVEKKREIPKLERKPELDSAKPKLIVIDHSNDPEPELPEVSRNPRYSIINRGDFWGWFDAQFGEVRLISRNPRDARRELARLNQPEKPHLQRCKAISDIIYGKA